MPSSSLVASCTHMAGWRSFKPFIFNFAFFFFLAIILLGPWAIVAEADDYRATPHPSPDFYNDGVGDTANGQSPPTPPPVSSGNSNNSTRDSSFKPGMAIVVGFLTTMFSVTFLLLLYVKHCKHGNVSVTAGYSGSPNSRVPPASTGRKNSGIGRAVIESLPVFKFGSLRGQKDGLECAICLTMFESTEVLRLLPKCKHAFHVECVDTWLDAHSTCPLCRYRVDPEDILLVEDARILHYNQPIPPPPPQNDAAEQPDTETERNGSAPDSEFSLRRVSGRHSSVGERSGFLRIILQKTKRTAESESESELTQPYPTTTTFRRSLDSATGRKKKETVAVGCLDRGRKDGLLLSGDKTRLERRLEHRIIVSPATMSSGVHERWSDVQGSDLLYLTSEMIMSDSRRFLWASGSRPSLPRQNMQQLLPLHGGTERVLDGKGVINARSVSEITELRRFGSSSSNCEVSRDRRV